MSRPESSRAQAWLDDASAILQRPLAEYRENTRERDLSAFYLGTVPQDPGLRAAFVFSNGTDSSPAGSTFLKRP
jgi:hypothetical protein